MPGTIDLKDFLAGFLIEADEHLHAVNRNLVSVAAALRAGRPEPRAVRELFRSLHTIKGLASMVGVEPIVDISHEMEGVLRAADRAGGRLSERELDLLLQGTRAIEERVQATAQSGIAAVPAAPAPLLEALAVAQSAPGRPGTGAQPDVSLPEAVSRSLSASDREQLAQAGLSGQRVVLVEFLPSAERAARGFNITAVRSRLAQLGELVKVVPRSLPAAPTGIAFDLLLVTNAANPALAAAVDGAADAVRDVAVKADAVGGAGEAVAEALRPADARAHPRAQTAQAQWAPTGRSIRVDVRRLDEVLEQLSALVVSRFKMVRAAAQLASRGADTRELDTVISENGRQLRRLRAAITEARMVPLAELLERLPLVVRGLTKDSDRSVEIEIRAGSAEVDKAVADRLFPAVVHLVRNAVDHAIESREERRSAGKPEAGMLVVVCDDSPGTMLILQVTDDGRGIDRDAVARTLRCAPARTEDELLQQIASPGLSTREATTRASGRGMGMEIVKRTVEALGGSVTLQTAPGKGTTFTMRVPVSISIVDVLSFACAGETFVAPIAMIDEIVEIDPAHLVAPPATVHDAAPAPRLVPRRGDVIPLVSLGAMLAGRSDAAVPPKALIVKRERGAVAFGVDRMLGQQEVVVRPLEDALVRVPGVSGATDLGDGKPTLVLDLGALGAAIRADGAAPA